jgi:uncharacterized membrane protein
MMTYDRQILANLPVKDGFRLRGTEMTRLETFMDAAFAFAMTLLVISVGDLPGNYHELVLALKDIPAFGASFAAFMTYWVGHRRWSRRYGLEDGATIFLSLVIIFVMLVYIYPLKLVFSALFAWLSGGWIPSKLQLSHIQELIDLFVIYGLGFMAMSALMALLYLRALRARTRLCLNDTETLKTREEVTAWSILAVTGLASALMALITPDRIAVYSGFMYNTLIISMPVSSIMYNKKLKALESEPSQTSDE